MHSLVDDIQQKDEDEDARQRVEIGQGLSLAIYCTNSLSEECSQEYMNFILRKLVHFAEN
jgi:hypothetical protein